MKNCNNDEIKAGLCGISSFLMPLSLLLVILSVILMIGMVSYQKLPWFASFVDSIGAMLSYWGILVFLGLFLIFNIGVLIWVFKNPKRYKAILRKAKMDHKK